MKELIVGIDLGTTNSEIGVLQSGDLQLFKEANGKQVIPSVICFTESGELLVGEEAKNLEPLLPENAVSSVKRLMGSDTQLQINDQTYTPQAISAMILKKLKTLAETTLGQAVHKAVITVPAYFDDKQRQATKDAGSIAGLEVVRLINEPTAASLAYEGQDEEPKALLVYDLGGGTFDVSVVETKGGLIEVIATAGDNHLGGDDFDAKIEEFLLTSVQEQHSLTIQDKKTLARIKRIAESVKMTLSDEPYAEIKEDYLAQNEAGETIHLTQEFSRQTYEKLIEPLVEKTLDAVHQALQEANKQVDDIDEVLLVGGSTRTPIIRTRLREMFKKQPRVDLHPDLCVAMGASIQAGVLGGEKQTRTLIDITPYAFGTTSFNPMTMEHRYHVLIEKNSPLPITKSEVFYPLFDDQDRVEFTIYQGESENYKDNTEIGEFTLKFSPHSSGDKAIVANYNLDLNGILTVTGTEKATGKKEQIVIENSLASQDEEKIQQAKALLEAVTPETEQLAGNEASRLIQEVEGKLADFEEEDRMAAEELITDLKEALEAQDEETINQLTEALSDLKFYLESHV